MDLFDYARKINLEKESPLSARIRPKKLEEFFDSLFAFPYSEKNFIKKFQEGLPEILRKQGWIK